MSSFGIGGSPFGRGAATFGRGVTSPHAATSTPTAWPPQYMSKGRGITLNGPDWEARANTLWSALSTAGKATLQRGACRIEVRGDSLEPSPGVYDFSTGGMSVVSNKVAWLQAHSIRPYLTYSYHPPFYVQPITVSVTVSRVNTAAAGKPAVWRARLTGSGIGQGNFAGIHVRCNGVPTSVVSSQGSTGGTPYVTLDHDVSNPGAIPAGAQTATFGPYLSGTSWPYAEQDRHMGIATAHMLAVAKANVEMVHHYRSSNPILGGYNEVNGQFRRPAQDVDNETLKQRFIYAAVKEYDPSIPVILSSVSNAGGTDTDGWSLDGRLYLQATWQAMKADTTWHDTWVKRTTATMTSASVSTNNLAALLTAGVISDRIYADGFDDHTYGWTRVGNPTGWSEGDDNIGHWMRPNNSIAVKWAQIVNDLHDEDPTASKNGLAHMLGCSGETGLMFDPRARTGVGLLAADAPELPASIPNGVSATGSDEETYVHDTLVYQFVDQHRAWPTGGSIPVYTGPKADPNRHWAFVSMQRLSETDETYAGAATFYSQGYFSRAGVLKRSSRTSRPHLNSGTYTNASIGNGVDKVDALDKDWA